MSQRERKRILRSNSDLSGDSDLDLPVANVNKNNSGRQKGSKNKNLTKDGKQKRKSSSKMNKGSKNKRRKNDKEHETSFIEEDRLIQMRVDEGEDDFSSDEVAREQDDSDTQNSSIEEGLIESDDNEEDTEIVFKQTELENAGKTDSDLRKNTVDELKKIEKEMKQRIDELHKLLKTGEQDLANDSNTKEKGSSLNGKGDSKSDKNQSNESPQGQKGRSSSDLSSSNLVAMGDGNTNVNANLAMQNPIAEKNKAISVGNSKSMDTIYEPAVPKRNSSSSDEFNSSDEFGNLIEKEGMLRNETVPTDNQIEVFIAEARKKAATGIKSRVATQDEMGPQPSTSAGPQTKQLTPEEIARNMVKEAERAKAKIFASPGNEINMNNWSPQGRIVENINPQINELAQQMNNLRQVNEQGVNFLSPSAPAALVDEGYIVVGAHLDETMINKIAKGEYVDFGKLLPRDKVLAEDDSRMEMVMKNGRAYWVPVSISVNIGNFTKWEQAFRVFSNIYCKANPQRAAELIEYNHVIHTVASAYAWDNVYNYDKEFRLHMARNPQRSWAIILQQAWSLRLRDRIMNTNTWANSNYNGGARNSFGGNNNGMQPNKELCRRFNRGRCNFGTNCKYEHKCSYCYKFGHSNFNCRKAIADRDRKNNTTHNTTNNGHGHQGQGQGQGHNHHNHNQAVVAQESGDKK